MSSLFCLLALRMKYHIDLRAIPILVFLSLGLTLFQTFLLLHFVKKSSLSQKIEITHIRVGTN